MSTNRRLVAILFTDIVGYTTMIQEDEQKAIDSAGLHQQVLEACTAAHRGDILQYYGDGSLTIFPSATEAVKCAVNMQQNFQKESLPLRMGIALGEVRLEGEKVFGSGVNIASRLEGLGVAGSIIISEKVKEEVKNQAGISARLMGIFDLKNVENPMQVYAVDAEGITVPDLREMKGKAKLLTKGKQNKQTSLMGSTVKVLAGWGAITLIVALLGMYWYFDGTKAKNNNYTFKPLTTTSWFEGNESWSPDGSLFTFVSFREGKSDIYIRPRKGGDLVQIVGTPYDDYSPRWSTDGAKIAFISPRPEGANIYLVPATGGAEKKLAETRIPGVEQSMWALYALGSAPWSPDGNELLFSQIQENGALGITKLNLTTGEETYLTHPAAGELDFEASWSSDGSAIVFTRNRRLWFLNLEDEEPEYEFLPDQVAISPIFSADGEKIIVSIMKNGVFNLFDMEISSRELVQLTSSNNWLFFPSLVPGGGLSVNEFKHQIDLRILDLESLEHDRLTFYQGNNYGGRYAPDGNSLLYHSNRTGNYDVWKMDLNNGNKEIQLSSTEGMDFCADWSPDGKEIAFFSNRDGKFHVWLMDQDGRNLRKASDQPVTFGSTNWTFLHQLKWSPDGTTIAYMAMGENGQTLWLINVETREARELVGNINTFAWYLDKQIIIFNRTSSEDPALTELVAMNIRTGEEKTISQGLRLTELFFSRDGQWMGYTSAMGHFSFNLHRIKLQPPNNPDGFPSLSGEPEQLTFGAGEWHVHQGCFSPDGKSILFSTDKDELNVFVIEDYL
jgi:Tol biopolymer transport system component/class 3 adenylate cyclase